MDPFRPDNSTPVIPGPAVRRVSLYLRQLEAFRRDQRKTISSKQLGESLGFTDAQIRKDLAYFGQFGHPGVGYSVDELIGRLRHILGTDKTWNVLLVGAGNLGRALMAYRGFDAKGFRLAAVFDNDPSKVRNRTWRISRCKRSIRSIRHHRSELGVRVAILAVPAEVAQATADRIISAGVRGILNFAPLLTLNVPAEVAVTNVDLAVHLEQLSFQVNLSAAANRDPS